MNREEVEAKMTDREALAAALDNQQTLTLATAADLIRIGILPTKPSQWEGEMRDRMVVFDAARERLAQLPEKCGICDGTGWIPVESDDPLDDPCPPCHGSGKVYPAELVERIAEAISKTHRRGRVDTSVAVAVLDALNGETE